MLRRLVPAVAAWLFMAGTALAAVDANTATREQLDAIRGIGPALSERIVAERGKAPFRDMNDLQQRVRGIGAQTAKKLEAAGLTVGGSAAGSAPGTGTAPAARITTLGSGVVTEANPGASGQSRAPAGAAAGERREPRSTGK